MSNKDNTMKTASHLPRFGRQAAVAVILAASALLAGAATLQAAEVVHSVTGCGRFSIIPDTGEIYNEMTMCNAQLKSDGTVQGQALYQQLPSGFFAEGTVFDLKVEGNLAKVSILVKRTANWTEAGGVARPAYGFLVIIDNGKQPNAEANDAASYSAWLPEDDPQIQAAIDASPSEFLDFWVSVGFDPPAWDIVHGGFTVR